MDNDDAQREILRLTLAQSTRASYLAIAGAVIIAAIAAPGVGWAGAAAWAGATAAVLLGRNALLGRVAKTLDAPGGIVRTRRLLSSSSVVMALTIATLPVFAFPHVDAEQRFLLTLFFCCWCVAGLPSLGSIPAIYTTYLGLMLGGIVAGWFRARYVDAFAVLAGLVIYWMVLTMFALNFARRVTEGIEIRNWNARLVRQLSAANAAKTRFIMNASHDLRQPLHAISLLGGVLARASDPHALASAREALGLALAGLNHLFSEILDLSRIDSGTVRPNPRNLPLHQLVVRLDTEYRILCLDRDRRWDCQIERAHVYTDPALFERIVRNLLDNALKHGEKGAVRLALAVHGQQATVSVSDTGPGIPPEQREQIFDEFFRGSDTASTSGMGLGLSIVRGFARSLGCHLSLTETDPQTHRGTCIAITLPLVSADAQATDAPGDDDAAAQAVPEVAGLKVLVVDDDQAVLDATRALLSQWACDVRLCRTRAQIEQLRTEAWQPDVVMVDYRFEPGLNGLEAIAELRAQHPDLGVIVVTGESDEAVLKELSDSGLPKLDKPVDPGELRRMLGIFRTMD